MTFEHTSATVVRKEHGTKIEKDKIDAELREAGSKLASAISKLEPDERYAPTLPSAYAVGGFVRDMMCGIKSKDIDVEVYGVDPQRLKKLLESEFERVDTVGEAFGILKVFLGNGLDMDVSIPRRESKSGQGHKGFLIDGDPSLDVCEAALRRDFTMNSMAYDLARGVVFDPFGGLRDLKERKLRVTDPERFQDDPLRVLRAAQFCSRFELVVEPESFELMKTMVEKGDLNELSSERVLEEWRKLLTKSGRPSIGIELLRALGAVKKHFPELGALIGVEQEREWHPEGDVWMHSMMVVDKAAEIIRKVGSFSKDEIDIVMFGALCHDFGKPLTTETIKGKLRTLGHEEAGEMPAREFLRRMKVSNDLEDGVVRCVREHLKPAVLYTELMKGNIDRRQYANAIRKVLKRVSPLPWRVLLAVCEADHRGRAILGVDTGPYEAGEKMAEVVEQEKLDEAPTVPLIQGRDVLALAKSRKIDRRPDRWVGDAIRAIEALRDEGEITTREQALAALQKMEF